jgi:nucleoid DNA-binding protein
MNQSELVEKVAQMTELDQATADQAVKAVVNTILNALSAGEPVRVAGFGVFELPA